MFYEGGHRNGIHKIPFTFFLSLYFLWINSIFIFFIFQIFVQILANSIDITDVTMACVDGVTKLRISIPEDFKSFFKDGGSLVLRIQDPAGKSQEGRDEGEAGEACDGEAVLSKLSSRARTVLAFSKPYWLARMGYILLC